MKQIVYDTWNTHTYISLNVNAWHELKESMSSSDSVSFNPSMPTTNSASEWASVCTEAFARLIQQLKQIDIRATVSVCYWSQWVFIFPAVPQLVGGLVPPLSDYHSSSAITSGFLVSFLVHSAVWESCSLLTIPRRLLRAVHSLAEPMPRFWLVFLRCCYSSLWVTTIPPMSPRIADSKTKFFFGYWRPALAESSVCAGLITHKQDSVSKTQVFLLTSYFLIVRRSSNLYLTMVCKSFQAHFRLPNLWVFFKCASLK